MTKIQCDKYILRFLMFLVGLFSTTNAVYFFTIGNTPVSLIYIPVALLLLILSFQHKILKQRTLPLSLIFLFLFIVLSVLPVFLFNVSHLRAWFYGVIVMASYILVIYVIVLLKQYRDSLMWGILLGITINAVFSLVAYNFYKKGSLLSLSSAFPSSNISQPNIWNSFASMGLFCEPGHLMRYLAIIALPILSFCKKKSTFLFLIIAILLSLLMISTKSASLGIFIIGVVVYLVYLIRKRMTNIIYILLPICIIFAIGYALVQFVPFLKSLYKSFLTGINDLFMLAIGSSGSARIEGMTYALEVIKSYPLIGCGWNTITQVFIKSGYYGFNNVDGAYSAALSLIAEIGIFSLFFFYFIFSCFRKLKKNDCDSLNVPIAFSLMIYFTLFLFTDYEFDPGSCVFLALAIAQIYTMKNKELLIVGHKDSFVGVLAYE